MKFNGDIGATVNAYWQAGLQTIPIRPDGTKAPALKTWKPYQDPSNRVELHLFAGQGVAVVCGRASGGLEVIDFDEPSLFEPWCEQVEEQSPGLIQRLVVIQTPRQNDAGQNGRHVYYRCPEPSGNEDLAFYADKKASIQTRGEGGYVLAPGSPPSCHATGRCYDVLAGELTDLPMLTMEERNILFDCARALTHSIEPEILPDREGNSRDVVGDSPGDEFAAVTSWHEILSPHGWTRIGDSDLWRRPGKERGWSASTKCRATLSGRELLKVFSSNASPFAMNGKYNKFTAFTMLNHGGNWTAAAADLYNQGFGMRDNRDVDLSGILGEGSGAEQQGSGQDKGPPVRTYRPDIITSAELDAAVYEQRFLVDNILAERQPTIVGGRSKAMKTSVSIDLALSLGTGTPFLDQYETIQSRVLMLSGESGRRSIQDTAKAVCNARGLILADAQVSWGFKLPCICRQLDMAELAKVVMGECESHPHRINVVIIDPAYLCLLDSSTKGLQASNLFDMGSLLLGLSEWGERTDTTVILCHHCRKGSNAANPYAPPEREDLSMAGFHEWARQWLLLGRRSAYEQGSGHHELWLEVGGSAGHGALLAIDIEEGAFATRVTKQWNVSVMSHGDAKEQAQRAADQQKDRKRQEVYCKREAAVVAALRQCREGETKTRLKELTGVPSESLSEVLLNLMRVEKVELVPIHKHTKEYDGYRPTARLLE
ncbi:MAG: AAA family ATPase [Pirellulaceae bacterium]